MPKKNPHVALRHGVRVRHRPSGLEAVVIEISGGVEPTYQLRYLDPPRPLADRPSIHAKCDELEVLANFEPLTPGTEAMLAGNQVVVEAVEPDGLYRCACSERRSWGTYLHRRYVERWQLAAS